MKRSLFLTFLMYCLAGLPPTAVMAGPDRYVGDGAIYTGEATYVRPNVLFIFDNNSTMGNTSSVGDPYNPAVTYAGDYSPWTVYKVVGMGGYVAHITNANSTLPSVTCAAANTALRSTAGSYSGSGASELKNDGSCANGGAGLVYLGNFLNYSAGAGAGGTDAQVRIVREALLSIVSGTRGIINYGLMTFGENKSGGRIVRPVADISSDAAYSTFISYVPGTGSTGTGTGGGGTYADGPSPAVGLLSGNGRPLAEALYDAGAYFKGVYPIIYNQGSFTSPIQYSCQKNYVIVITNGDTDLDNNPKLGQATALGTVGNYYTGDGYNEAAGGHSYGTGTHYMDDVAKFIYDNDMGAISGTQRVVTHAVQIFSPDKPLVRSATVQGHGSYYVAADANAISSALIQIITSIVLETNSSFVAPVVPVSPENRTYSGSRVYLGFFKPQSGKPWLGNIKKFGLQFGSGNQVSVVDKNDDAATNSDGSIKTTAISYWSTTADGGNVDSGGTGALLLTATRSIYTYTGTSTALTNSSNAFTTTNGAITHATLGVADSTAKDKLVGFVRGVDAYDDDGDGDTSEKRPWILGDIMHSKPLIINYATFAAANEGDCNLNKTMIYVGANDGMLHAFKDCDGSEAWAFIPPDLLGNLKYLRESSHAYFVDGTPMTYIYDADRDGNIESGDKVILMFGERRGGGKDANPTGGFYYALDVTDPANPVYMWKLGNSFSPSGTHTDYAEMGETWSDPKIGKVRIGSTDKIVAIVGAGYDNLNEDTRYGATQTFNGAGTVVSTDLGSGNVTSSGASSPVNPKGRGVYMVEIAALNASGVPSFTNSGYKVWGHTYGASNTSTTSTAMTFSIPSDVVMLDTDNNGYVDRFYVGDTGGNMWRFNVGSTDTSNWTATKIFASNPGSGGSSDVGRKIFYRPTTANESSYILLLFGTGDREHPLNRDVVDRMYAVKDTGQSTAKVESDLTDVTTDTLQTTTDIATVNSILDSLNTSAGWYIKLNEAAFDGEKVLANPLLFNKRIYFTTHTPNADDDDDDPCSPGNLGTGRLYEMNYKTGEAVVNYDTSNDGTVTNSRANPVAGQALLRNDRVLTIGSGIPSAAVSSVGNSGVGGFIGMGGGMRSLNLTGGGVMPIYWRER